MGGGDSSPFLRGRAFLLLEPSRWYWVGPSRAEREEQMRGGKEGRIKAEENKERK